ncbi:winged helix-turn-helix domain-containing protein [Klebsiella sp. R445]
MKGNYIINEKVIFFPDEHRLEPLGNQGVALTLNIPVSRCLLLLLQREGEVVGQNEIIAEVWENNGQYANSNTYFQNIHILRKSLKISGIEESVIITVPKEGLRFTGMVAFDHPDIPPESPEVKAEPVDGALQESTPEVKITSTPFLSGRCKAYVNLTLILCLLATFIMFSHRFYANYRQNTDFFSDYRFLGEMNQCQVYASGGSMFRQHVEYLDFIQQKNIQCQSGQMAYMSINNVETRVLVHLCDKNMKDAMSCLTKLYMVDNKNEE